MSDNNQTSILVIDDDREVLVSFQIWLEGEGYTSFTASNSAEAIKALEEHTIDVALVDFKLATEDGLAVAELLKKIDKDLKIIIITGYPSYETALKSMKAGLFDYLSKGESNEKIIETIRKAVRERDRERIENGEAHPRESFLKFIVICKHSLIKERLDAFSKKYPDFKLMRTYNSLQHFLKAEYVPEVDIALVCTTCCIKTFDDSFAFFDELYKALPMVKPILFNEYFNDTEKVELIKIGVKGFFSIDMDSEKLEKALSLIKKGEIWTSRKLINRAVPDGPEYLKTIRSHLDSYGLSTREKEILKALVLGLKNKEIADKLFISEMTVKSHINRIYKKFGVNNRARAIRFAMENKIL